MKFEDLPGAFLGTVMTAGALPAPQLKLLLFISNLTMNGKKPIHIKTVLALSDLIAMSPRSIYENLKYLCEGGWVIRVDQAVRLAKKSVIASAKNRTDRAKNRTDRAKKPRTNTRARHFRLADTQTGRARA